MSALLLLWACTNGEPDRTPYLEALQAADPARCATIGEPGLRSDCLAQTAPAAQLRGEDGAAVCAAIPIAAWQSECFFGLAEATGSLGFCQQAGRFGAACADHLFEQAILGAELQARPGEEQALQAAIAPWVERYFPESPPRYRQVRQERALAWALEPRLVEPLTPAFCGVLPEAVCVQALLGHLHHVLVPGGDATGICADGRVSAAESASVGAMTWQAEGAALAGQAWDVVCQGRFRLSGPTRR